MNGELEFRQITRENMESLSDLILPMIYEELDEQEHMEEEYIAIAAYREDKPVGAIVCDMEADGDLTLLSVWTEQSCRRQGVASALLQKMTEVALQLYDWEKGQFGDDIVLSAMYCLPDRYRKPLEEWLMKNDFTDFAILRPAEEDRPEICAASAEIHFMRYE